MAIYIGTSGWGHDHWRGPFYPREISGKHLFDYYSARFNTVEINNSFYRLPTEATVDAWRDAAPDGFVFSMKASQYLTHKKRLINPERYLPRMIDVAKRLGAKLGPLLFQLPPSFHRKDERLQGLFEVLPPDLRYAVEFRDASWFDEAVRDLLSSRGVAFCIFEFGDLISPQWVTADFVYVRMHGPVGPYLGSYSRQRLEQWAARIASWDKQGKDVFLYFNNDESGYAPHNAVELRALLTSADERPASPD